jgi:hypothetical protein
MEQVAFAQQFLRGGREQRQSSHPSFPFTDPFFSIAAEREEKSGEQAAFAQPFLWGGGELRVEGGE